MFERFTERARKVVVLAQEEARSFGHAYIGTEHILLGLVRESGSRAGAHRYVGPPRSARHRLMFRGQVLAFEVQVHYGTLGETVVPQTPQTVSVELDYAYAAQKNGDVLLGTVDPSDVREGVARVLAEEEFVLPEAGLVRAGEYVLEEFQTVQEITVNVTVPRASDPGRSPGARISGTFRR